jgi:hypothetical protein
MISSFKRFSKSHNKVFVVFLVAFLALSGCASAPPLKRNFAFTENVKTLYRLGKSATISLQGLDINHDSFAKRVANTKEEMSQMLKNRLGEHLKGAGLNPVMAGSAMYNMNGTLVVTEKEGINGWIVPGILVIIPFCIGVITCPIGYFVANAFPATTITEKTTADINLIQATTNKSILTKSFEKTEKCWINGYQGDIVNPDSKTNSLFVQTIDEFFMDITKEVATVIATENE